jgi:hypothetical protein
MQNIANGLYENGVVTLFKKLPTQKAKVLVTIVEDIDILPTKKRPFGIMKGGTKLSVDFNEPIYF